MRKLLPLKSMLALLLVATGAAMADAAVAKVHNEPAIQRYIYVFDLNNTQDGLRRDILDELANLDHDVVLDVQNRSLRNLALMMTDNAEQIQALTKQSSKTPATAGE